MAKKTAATQTTAPATNEAVYVLSEAAIKLATSAAGGTTQAAPGQLGQHGKGWRNAAQVAPNTRAIALAALVAALGSPTATFTLAQVKAAWANGGAGFTGSATPASRIRAFVANGYFAPPAAQA